MLNPKKLFSRRRKQPAAPDSAARSALAVVNTWTLPGVSADALKSLAQTWSDVTDPIDDAFRTYTNRPRYAEPIAAYPAKASLSLTGTLWHAGTEYTVYVKGTPEQIIKHVDLTENEREQLHAQYRRNQAKGYVSVAIATTKLANQPASLKEALTQEQLTFSCLVALEKRLDK